MKFLDKIYSEGEPEKKEVPTKVETDGKQGKSDEDSLSIVMSVIDQAIKLKDVTKLSDFISGLDESHKNYLKQVNSSRSKGQEKAVISALLNKYPKLLTDKKQTSEFKAHVTNLMGVNKLDEGALKYLLDRLVSKTVVEDKKSQEDKEPKVPQGSEQPTNEDGQPEAQPAEGENGQQPVTEGEPTDTVNSDVTMDFYDAWEDQFNDTESDLTEEEFSDLINSEEIESILNDSNYASISFGRSTYNANPGHGAVIGAITGGIISLSRGAIKKINSHPLRKRLSKLDKELYESLTTKEQELEVESLLKLIKKGKLLGLVRSKLNNNKSLFTKDQIKILAEVIYIYSQLRRDEKDLGIKSLTKSITSGAIKGFVLTYLANIFLDDIRVYSNKDLAYDFLKDRNFDQQDMQADQTESMSILEEINNSPNGNDNSELLTRFKACFETDLETGAIELTSESKRVKLKAKYNEVCKKLDSQKSSGVTNAKLYLQKSTMKNKLSEAKAKSQIPNDKGLPKGGSLVSVNLTK